MRSTREGREERRVIVLWQISTKTIIGARPTSSVSAHGSAAPKRGSPSAPLPEVLSPAPLPHAAARPLSSTGPSSLADLETDVVPLRQALSRRQPNRLRLRHHQLFLCLDKQSHKHARQSTTSPSRDPSPESPNSAATSRFPPSSKKTSRSGSATMSSETAPISPTRFAEALKDLSAENIALKVFELRNSIAHLDYSNAELRPYAEGLASVMGSSHATATTSTSTAPTTTTTTTPQTEGSASIPSAEPKGDQDCIDAIAENKIVIARMLERIDLIKTEVESRGLSWRELSGRLPDADDADTVGAVPQSALDTTSMGTTTTGTTTATAPATNGVNGTATNGVTTSSSSAASAGGAGQLQGERHSAWTDGTFQTGTIRSGGAGLTDDELLRRLQEQIPGLGDEDDEEGGMHL